MQYNDTYFEYFYISLFFSSGLFLTVWINQRTPTFINVKKIERTLKKG